MVRPVISVLPSDTDTTGKRSHPTVQTLFETLQHELDWIQFFSLDTADKPYHQEWKCRRRLFTNKRTKEFSLAPRYLYHRQPWKRPKELNP